MEPRQLICLKYSDIMGGGGTGGGELERTDPAGPSGIPDLILRAKDPDQDFKQDIIWLPCEE